MAEDKFAKNMLAWMARTLENVIPASGSGGTEMRANCPFCISRIGKDDAKAHLYVSKVKRAAICFRCEWEGSWHDLIMEVDGCSFTSAIQTLASPRTVWEFEAAIESLLTVYPEEKKPRVTPLIPQAFQTLKPDGGLLHQSAYRYLQCRKVPEWVVNSGMFGVVPGEMYLYALVSPTYWQARTMISGMEPKYKNPGVEVGDTFAIWDSPYIGEQVRAYLDPVYIVEGIFSALALVSRSKPVVAILGKIIHAPQLKRLARLRRPLRVLLDSDVNDSGFELANKLIGLGKTDVDVAVLEYGDPESCELYTIYKVDWVSQLLFKLGA